MNHQLRALIYIAVGVALIAMQYTRYAILGYRELIMLAGGIALGCGARMLTKRSRSTS